MNGRNAANDVEEVRVQSSKGQARVASRCKQNPNIYSLYVPAFLSHCNMSFCAIAMAFGFAIYGPLLAKSCDKAQSASRLVETTDVNQQQHQAVDHQSSTIISHHEPSSAIISHETTWSLTMPTNHHPALADFPHGFKGPQPFPWRAAQRHDGTGTQHRGDGGVAG